MLKNIIQNLASNGDEKYIKVCKITSVNLQDKTADLQPLDESSPINDAYLIVDNEKGGQFLEPKVGSMVAVAFISNTIGLVVGFSELKQYLIQIESTQLQIDKDGFLLKKQNETLAKLMSDLLKEIQKMKFTTNTGSTILLINQPQFMAIENRFKDFLKDD